MVGRGWMSGASIEETLELWAASLREVKARMRPLFTQDRVAASAGLFGGGGRKTGWMRAGAGGGLGGSVWGGAAQDRLDAGGSGWRPRSLAAAGDPGAWPLGCRRVARYCARVRGRDACRTECRPGG